jgi:hypothetical protein
MLPTPDLPPISSSDPRDFTPEPEVIRDVYKALRDFRICRVIRRARGERRARLPGKAARVILDRESSQGG